MSYASKNEIKSMFRDFSDNADAAVDDTDLDLFLANSTAIIDAKIGTLYSMPITLINNPQSFAILKQLQMFKVACEVDEILNSYGEADKKPTWCKKAMLLMTELIPEKKSGCTQCEPTMKLPDTPYLGTTTQQGQIRIGATTGTTFTKGANNW